MITPNAAPRDYKYTYTSNHEYQETGTYASWEFESVNVWQLLYGNAFAANTMGLQVRTEADVNVLSPPSVSTITFHHPWGTADTYSINAFQGFDWRIEIDEVTLTLNAACEAVLHFDELRYYVDDGDGFDLRVTIGEQTENISDFDHRLNYARSATNSEIVGGHTPNPTDCTPPIEDPDVQGAYTKSTTGALVGGWQWTEDGVLWETDEVEIQTVSTPSLSCDCDAPIPEIVFDIDQSSDNINIESYHRFEWSHDELCSWSCPGPDCSIPHTRFKFTAEWELGWTWINAVAITAPMRVHQTTARDECTDDGGATFDEDVATVTEPLEAHSEFEQDGYYWICTSSLIVAYPPPGPPCPIGDDCEECPYTDTSCYNRHLLRNTWPVRPPCLLAGGVSYDVSLGMRHHRALILDGKAWTGYTGNNLPAWTDTNTGLDATNLTLRLDRTSKTGAMVLLIEDAGSVYEYLSADGVTWTLATTIATGTRPCAVIRKNGQRHIFWLDGTTIKSQIRDAANTVVKATFTPSGIGTVDDYDFDVDESFRADGSSYLVLLCVVSGSVTQYTSPDGVAFS